MINGARHELLRFKNGVFDTIRYYYASDENDFSSWDAFFKLKVHQNGTYSFFSTLESKDMQAWELLVFNKNHEIIDKYALRKLLDDKYDTNPTSPVEYLDYLFDANGSLWMSTKSGTYYFEDSNGIWQPDIEFAGIVEVNTQ